MLRNSYYKTQGGHLVYERLLDQVRQMYDNKYKELVSAEKKVETEWQLKQIIRCLSELKVVSEESIPLEDVAKAIVADMSGNSFIDQYLAMPGFQELNINAYNYATVRINDRISVVNAFASPKQGVDIMKRLVGGKLDSSTPAKVSNISDDTRIAAAIYPVMSKETAVFASIRKVDSAVATDSELVSSKEATPEILDLIKFCSSYGASVCMAGRTGSGKSTLESYFLKYLSIEKKKRVIIIQDGSRQISITKYGTDGRPVNDVVSFLTRRSEIQELDINQSKLIELMVKSDPDVVCVDEMVSNEAYDTIRAARTGHIVYSSIHSQNAERTYSNIATLALSAKTNYSFDTMLRLSVEAFPLIVYINKMEDKIRRVTEVIEGEGYDPAKGPVFRTLYRFNTTNTIYHSNGSVEVIGKHEKVHGISDGLQQILRGNGAPNYLIEKYAKEN